MDHRPLEICKPEVKTTVSARPVCIRNTLLPLPKLVLKNKTEQRSPVCSTCHFGHVSSYLIDWLFSRCQLCVQNQLMIFHFQLSGLPLVKVVIKGWHFSLAYITYKSGLVWYPYPNPFSCLWFISICYVSWHVTWLIYWKRIENREEPWLRNSLWMLFCFLSHCRCYGDLGKICLAVTRCFMFWANVRDFPIFL